MQTFKIICMAFLCIAARAYPSDDSANKKIESVRPKLEWWENGVFYHIYPRSFKDSDGDGVGDIRGIIQGLDYLKELGVDGAWLSPIFKSPMVDFGYDTEDFYDVDPLFGTKEDLGELFSEAKKRDIKIILDLVPNHSSDKCEWFKKSVKREPGYEDLYLWADGKNNNTKPPNNWLSIFYGPAWTFVEERNQWYLHQFAKEQPEFNYRNEEVMKIMVDVLNFWFEKGANGFRLDAVNFFYEVEDLRDEPYSNMTTDRKDYFSLTHDEYTKNLGESFDIVYQFREAADKFQEMNKDAQIVLMSEGYVNDTDYVKYFGNGSKKGIQIPFNFVLIEEMDKDSTPEHVKKIIDKKIASIPSGFRLNWVLGNHDHDRISSRFGERRVDGLLTLIMTLPGIAVTYYGEEIGMVDNRTIPYDQTTDPQANTRNPKSNWMVSSRDPERTPLQWNSSKFAGFMPENSTGRPWLPINENYKDVNIATQRQLQRSTLNFYKQLVQIRKRDTFAYGSYTSTVLNEHVFAYVRELENSDTYWVLINLSIREAKIDLTKNDLGKNVPQQLELALVGTDSCYENGAKVNADEIVLRKYDTIILKSVLS